MAIGWLGGLFREEPVVTPDPVDYVSVASAAGRDARFPLAVPSALPDGWRATSARWDRIDEHWHIGILTADDEYVGVEQSGSGSEETRRRYAPGTTEDGTVAVAGRQWLRLLDDDGTVTLLREAGESTTVVSGSVSERTLVAFAAGLSR